jgi:hypothetical protein
MSPPVLDLRFYIHRCDVPTHFLVRPALQICTTLLSQTEAKSAILLKIAQFLAPPYVIPPKTAGNMAGLRKVQALLGSRATGGEGATGT